MFCERVKYLLNTDHKTRAMHRADFKYLGQKYADTLRAERDAFANIAAQNTCVYSCMMFLDDDYCLNANGAGCQNHTCPIFPDVRNIVRARKYRTLYEWHMGMFWKNKMQSCMAKEK